MSHQKRQVATSFFVAGSRHAQYANLAPHNIVPRVHIGMGFVRRMIVLTGQDKAILAQRKTVMEAAKAQHSVRWGKRQVRNCTPVGPTTLNPAKEQIKQVEKQAA